MMKFSDARQTAWSLLFHPTRKAALLAEAKRVSIQGASKRYGFKDGSALEEINGRFKVVSK